MSKTIAEHESELVLYKAAKEAFNQLPEKKILKTKDLNIEYAELLKSKKKLYSQYRQSKKEMQDFVIAKQNVDSFCGHRSRSNLSKKRETQKQKNTER